MLNKYLFHNITLRFEGGDCTNTGIHGEGAEGSKMRIFSPRCDEASYKIMLPTEGGKHSFKKYQKSKMVWIDFPVFWDGGGGMICIMYICASLVGPKSRKEHHLAQTYSFATFLRLHWMHMKRKKLKRRNKGAMRAKTK